ncbi:MAG: hypothetical protein DHS20C18_21630 [Saprospiraceae bacterium]|nr:MAG: hypothetical protein DHS20C18_21630 [Saprospiraceae bacterium]
MYIVAYLAFIDTRVHYKKLLSEILDNDVIISVQDPVELNQYSEPEPDLAILKYRDDLYTKSHPKPADVLLVIEVADTSLEKDRAIKLPLYAAAGIREVWIINLEEQQIEVSTEPGEKGYSNLHIYRKGEIVEHALIGELNVSEVLITKD